MIRALLTGLVLGSAMAAAGAPPPAELTGVITQMDGDVSVSSPGAGDAVPSASPWQVVRRGDTIRVLAGGAAGIACSNQRFARLRGSVSWSLTEPSCAAGKKLTPAEYALVAPQAGRFNVVNGFLVLERVMRAGDADDPLSPFVLGPRNTTLSSPRPMVSWLKVPSASEYRVEWSGRGTGAYTTRLDAAETPCAKNPDGLDVCSLPWPADRADLAPGQTFFLRIAARESISGPWHRNEPVEVRTPSQGDVEKLKARLESLESLGLTGGGLAAARAGVLAEAGRYADAAEAYRRALATTSSGSLRMTLADVELAMGLHRFAEPIYREESAGGDPVLRAAAFFGLGRLAYARDDYVEATADFRQAQNLYRGAKLAEEEAAARKAAERAAARVPH